MLDDLYSPSIKIKYENLAGDESVYWPIVRVHLWSNTFSFPQNLIALVDSGASHSIIRQDIAQVLGFPVQKLKFDSTGNSVNGTYKSATLSERVGIDLYGYKREHKFTVIDYSSLIFPIILGEDSLFKWTTLNFNRSKLYFEMRFRTDIN